MLKVHCTELHKATTIHIDEQVGKRIESITLATRANKMILSFSHITLHCKTLRQRLDAASKRFPWGQRWLATMMSGTGVVRTSESFHFCTADTRQMIDRNSSEVSAIFIGNCILCVDLRIV